MRSLLTACTASTADADSLTWRAKKYQTEASGIVSSLLTCLGSHACAILSHVHTHLTDPQHALLLPPHDLFKSTPTLSIAEADELRVQPPSDSDL